MKNKTDNRGFITVFVVLMLVPMVTITGLMVDAARFKLCGSQAIMAADTYSQAVLSRYDNTLKELYGLFSVSQTDGGFLSDDEKAKLEGYAQRSFDPAKADPSLAGFRPYAAADVKFTCNPVPNASLSNGNVMLTQVGDFMQFRAVEQLISGNGKFFDTLESFEKMSADMDAMDQVQEIGEEGSEALNSIYNYYKTLAKLDTYPSAVQAFRDRSTNCIFRFNELLKSDDYNKYYAYLQERAEIDRCKGIKDQLDAGEEVELTEDELAHVNEYAEKYVDAEAYLKSVRDTMDSAVGHVLMVSNEYPVFIGAGSQLDSLEMDYKEIESGLTKIEEKVTKLKKQLENCSNEVRTGIQEEIKDLETVVENAPKFKSLTEDMMTNKGYATSNITVFNERIKAYNAMLADITDADAHDPSVPFKEPDKSLKWNHFLPKHKDFYNDLAQLYTDIATANPGTDEGKKEESNKKTEEVQAEIDTEVVTTNARNISSTLVKELGSNISTGEVKGWKDLVFGSVTAKEAFDLRLTRYLLASYDFGMFSSRVTGLDKDDTGNYIPEYSLTGYKMSPKINYLYGAELEYLFGGYSNSKDNLAKTRNYILAVRTTLNMASTYTVQPVHKAIVNISNAAGTAAAATGFGPLVKVATSIALRTAVAAVETAADWKILKDPANNNGEVLLYKRRLEHLSAYETVKSFLGGYEGVDAAPDGSKIVGLSYEDHLYVFLYLLIDTDTLAQRTGDLITLNVNQAKYGTDGDLSTLKFKISDSVTAVQTSCKVKMNFMIVPENFIGMFVSQETQDTMSEAEKNYMGYTIIRGY